MAVLSSYAATGLIRNLLVGLIGSLAAIAIPQRNPSPHLLGQVKAREASIHTGGRTNQDPTNFEVGLAMPAKSALKNIGKDKIAFLTFDDGPSNVTKQVLATLERNKVKATFFIVGSMAERNPEMLKKEFDSGHAIGNHSYTHDYRKIYRTTGTMMDEIDRTEAILERAIGPSFGTRIFRFPGGYLGKRSVFQGHKQLYAEALREAGWDFIDWNVDCGDTHMPMYTSKQLFNRVMSQSKGQKRVVVLMHDGFGHGRTAAALPSIIAGLKKRGYIFKTLE